MSQLLGVFPDAEQVVLDLLEQVQIDGDPVATVTVTGNPLDPPVIRVNRVGGTSDKFNDRPRLEISCFSRNRTHARSMDDQVRHLLTTHSGRAVNGVLIDRAREDTGPVRVPWDDPEIHRVVSSWVLTFRRQRAT